ncbi:MAG: hypothetical protein K2X38_03825 [Gemmataceae bacterium]|nr:hypothetical protein [Gemmataceae bacterium]
MTTDSPTWIARAVAGADRLAARPWSLFALVFFVHILARPYAGITHDAQLYAGQTLNRIDPSLLSSDLFFQYGSQDRFSLFSTIAAPLVRWMGLETAFFALYVACDLLFVLAAMRLLRTVLPGARLHVPALLLVAALPIAYGGQQCFHVHESFLTPRLPATALGMLAMQWALDRRWVRSLLCLVVAALLHPLMAAPAWAMAALTGLGQWKGPRAVLVVVGTSMFAFAALVASGFGERVFGPFDASWRESVMQATSAHFPEYWSLNDWLHIALAIAAVVGFVLLEPDAERRWFAGAIGMIGMAGVLGSIVFSQLPFALPMQIQPYRTLWPLMLMKAPLLWTFAVRAAASQNGWVRWLSPIAVATFTLHGFAFAEWMLPILLWPLALRWTASEGRRDLPGGLTLSLLVSGAVFALLPLTYLVPHFESLLRDFDFRAWYGLAASTILGLPLVLLLLQVRIRSEACLACGSMLALSWFLVPHTEAYQDRLTPDGSSARFVREYFEQHSPQRPLVVYSDANRLHRVWLDWRAQSWFDTWQTSGFIFARETAVEGKRRAEAIAPFAMFALRRQRDRMTADFQRDVCKLMACDFEIPAPTAEDLWRLCRDESIDILVLSTEFSGLAEASDGRVWIYDARKLRGPDGGLNAALPR